MREIITHRINELNNELTLIAVDEPGPGGANHKYVINNNESEKIHCCLNFQNGPIKEAGVNGITNEILIAVVIDRLEAFQKGKFGCADNEHAILHLRLSLQHLQNRTKDRIRRGVEGTHEV